MNAPQPIKGFGKLGNFARAILAYAKSIDLQSIIIETMPAGATAPPTAEITNPQSGKLVKIKLPPPGGLPPSPTVDGTYVLGVIVTSGVGVVQWLETDTCAS